MIYTGKWKCFWSTNQKEDKIESPRFEFVKSKNIIIETEKQNLNLWLPFKMALTATIGNSMMTGTVVDNNRDLCF